MHKTWWMAYFFSFYTVDVEKLLSIIKFGYIITTLSGDRKFSSTVQQLKFATLFLLDCANMGGRVLINGVC